MSKIDLGDLEKMSAEIADNLFNKQPVLENLEDIVEAPVPPPPKMPLRIEIPKTPVNPTHIHEGISKPPRQRQVSFQKQACDAPSTGGNPVVYTQAPPVPSTSSNEFFSIGSLNLPKQTLFLIIVLIVIGIALFYKTSG